MKNALKIAIQNGYKKDIEQIRQDLGYKTPLVKLLSLPIGEIVIDPDFWKALTKDEKLVMEWPYYWKLFFDHLIDQKDPEEFFNQLLK